MLHRFREGHAVYILRRRCRQDQRCHLKPTQIFGPLRSAQTCYTLLLPHRRALLKLFSPYRNRCLGGFPEESMLRGPETPEAYLALTSHLVAMFLRGRDSSHEVILLGDKLMHTVDDLNDPPDTKAS